MRLRTGDRGQAIAIARVLAVIIGTAAVYAVFDSVFSDISAKAINESSRDGVTTGHSYVVQLWDAIPFLVLILVLMSVIGVAVYQRQQP